VIRQLVGPNSEPAHSTYFTRRLEAFNDVVFGFTLSILATNLEHVNFDQLDATLVALGLYFGTFALTVSIWYTQYQTFHYAFVGERIDVLLNFTLLAFAVLAPFSLQSLMHQQTGEGNFFHHFVPYAVSFGTVFLLSGILKLRGLKRFGDRLEPKVQKQVFRAAIVGIATPIVFLLTMQAYQMSHSPSAFLITWLLAVIGFLTRRMRSVPSTFLPAGSATAA
jgi:uncharacterized membrane protein